MYIGCEDITREFCKGPSIVFITSSYYLKAYKKVKGCLKIDKFDHTYFIDDPQVVLFRVFHFKWSVKKAVYQRFFEPFERYFHLKMIVSVISTNLDRNLFTFFFRKNVKSQKLRPTLCFSSYWKKNSVFFVMLIFSEEIFLIFVFYLNE